MPAIESRIAQQHEVVRRNGGYLEATDRSLLEVTGADRAPFLHNLTTNMVNTLPPGEGNYAFAINTQGRALFDMDLLVGDEAILLSIDRRWTEAALAHLNKYIVVEDVQIRDVTEAWQRMILVGPKTPALIESLGWGNNFAALASLQHIQITADTGPLRLIKNNLGPVMRGEILVPTAAAETFTAELADRAKALAMEPIDADTLDTIRIECGVPASVLDIDEQVIPPETGQIERGISYVKGCYLGQEVIERMRSRGAMARQLVGMQLAGDVAPEKDAPVFASGREIGRVTSVCPSVALRAILTLGYVKTALAASPTSVEVAVDESSTAAAEIVALPLPAWRAGGSA